MILKNRIQDLQKTAHQTWTSSRGRKNPPDVDNNKVSLNLVLADELSQVCKDLATLRTYIQKTCLDFRTDKQVFQM